MYLSWVFLGILALSCTVISGSENQCSNAKPQPTLEFLTLAQEWPPTFCLGNQKVTSKSCRIPEYVNTWTIHGLWPDIETYPSIANCLPQQTFNYDTIKDIENELKRTWPALDMSDKIFWEHEWCTHGSCAQDCAELKGEKKYFSKAIELHQNYSIDMALKSASILPGNEYSLSDITKAIYGAFKVDSIVQCSTVNNKVLLQEVKICFQKNLTSMNCPNLMRLESTHRCDPAKRIYYPEMRQT